MMISFLVTHVPLAKVFDFAVRQSHWSQKDQPPFLSGLAKVPIGRAVLDYRWISDNCEHALAGTKNCVHVAATHAAFSLLPQ